MQERKNIKLNESEAFHIHNFPTWSLPMIARSTSAFKLLPKNIQMILIHTQIFIRWGWWCQFLFRRICYVMIWCENDSNRSLSLASLDLLLLINFFFFLSIFASFCFFFFLSCFRFCLVRNIGTSFDWASTIDNDSVVHKNYISSRSLIIKFCIVISTNANRPLWAISHKASKVNDDVCVYVWNIKKRWGHNNSKILNFIDLFYSQVVFMPYDCKRNQQPVNFIVNAPCSMSFFFQYLPSSIFIIIYDMLIPMSIIQF